MTLRRAMFVLLLVELSTIVSVAAGLPVPPWLIAAIGVLTMATAATEAAVGWRCWRRARAEGHDARAAALHAAEATVPPLAIKFVRFEARLYLSMFLWARRKQRGVGTDDQSFTYHRAALPVMWLFIGLSVAELILYEMLIPWETVRLVLLILDAWGVAIAVGLLAAIVVHPHVVRADTLLLRTGLGYAVQVPMPQIETAHATRKYHEGKSVALDDGALRIAVSGETTVRIKLREAIEVPLPRGGIGTATEVLIHADDPSGLARALRDTVPAVPA